MTTLHVSTVLYLSDLPRECIEDCTRPGCDAAPAVQHWREVLGFTVARRRAVDCLDGYGAWSREELNAKSDEEIAEIVLWLACWDFAEFITECEREGVDPYGERPEGFDPSCGSDLFVLE